MIAMTRTRLQNPGLFPALAFALVTSGFGCSDKCSGDLAEIRDHCPASFDGTLADLPPCPSRPTLQMAWRCGSLIGLSSSALTGISCYYDVASHRLVGGVAWTDIPTYCGDSYSKSYGRTPPESCSRTDDQVERWCEAETSVDAGP